MPPSRLSTFVIDCHTDRLDDAAAFWSSALRRGIKTPTQGDRYRDLATGPSEPVLMIQRVAHEGRVHLDIEADDIDAEVARLQALGATVIERVHSWVVMLAPTGQRFCVVRPQRPGLLPSFERASAQHDRLANFVGHFRGETKTWMDPSQPPHVASGELHVQALFGGRWLRLEQVGTVIGKPHAGEMLLGFNLDEAQHELCWADSFHTGSAMMFCTGAPREDGVISVLGSYAAGPERWGWRTELRLASADSILMTATNISPAGETWPAIETLWTRIQPAPSKARAQSLATRDASRDLPLYSAHATPI